jgi:hypothetical protein
MFKRKGRKRKTLDLEALLLEAKKIKKPRNRKAFLAEELKKLINRNKKKGIKYKLSKKD